MELGPRQDPEQPSVVNPGGVVLILLGGLLVLLGVRGTYKNVIEGLKPA